jgi:hypothetical protein
MSPHFYTEDSEAVGAVDRLAEILESGAHRRFIGASRGVG